MTLQDLAPLIHARRTALGLSQDRLAKLCGLSRATVNQLENGTLVDLGAAKLLALLALLGLELDARRKTAPLDALALLSQTASVSYRRVLLPAELAQALAVLGERPVTLARELTKQFEEVTTQPAQALTAWLDGSPQRSRGEFVVLLHPVPVVSDAGDSHRVLRLLLAELPLKTAVRLAAEITGASRNVLYDTALEWKREDGPQD